MKRRITVILLTLLLAMPLALTACGSSDNSGSDDSAPAGVSAELKDFLDEYELFVDEYIEFMQKYENANESDLMAMMNDYMDMIERLESFEDKLDAYDENEMSDADLEYYLEVTARIEKKLLDAM
ncbi:MAG: hypothetical protein PUD55_06160 [Firmicutes bacterium]|nr:hypothetical protein [Bacillota bacterium]